VTDHSDEERRSRAFLGHVAPEQEETLLHLLECPHCRTLARERLESGRSPTEAVALERPPGGMATFRYQRRTETLERFIQLLSAPALVRPELAGSEEFRDLDLADLLLARAAVAQPGDLETSEDLARLAYAIAEPVKENRWVGWANDVKARACVLVGSVRRLNQEWGEADEMFRKAVFHLTGPPDCLERAFYCWNLALLRADQGQLDEAVGLLWRAALIYRENGKTREEGCSLAQLGFCFLEEEQVERAIPPLARACQVLESEAALRACCAFALAYCHADLGGWEMCERFLGTARALAVHLPEGEPTARAAGFEGKIAALAGKTEKAAELLDESRRTLLAAGELHAAARISIDLGRIWAETGQWERLEEIVKDLPQLLPGKPDRTGTLFVLSFFVQGLRQGGDPDGAVASARSRLRCCRRDPVLALGYWPAEMNASAEDSEDVNPSLEPAAPAMRARHLLESVTECFFRRQ
jgi:tetratricopeptide (TPR) repeat protein